jgi:hypothetical protein
MVAEPLVIEFHEGQRDAVVARMVTMAESCKGWVNLSPGLDVDVPPAPRSPLAGLFSARGPDVPLGTWSAPGSDREPGTVGVQHGRGPQALGQLADLGITLPEGWRRLQDHSRRGIVLAVPPATEPAVLDRTLEWVLLATGALCPVPRTGEWRALCFYAI